MENASPRVAVFIIAFVAIVGLEALYNTLTHSTSSGGGQFQFHDRYLQNSRLAAVAMGGGGGFRPAFEEAFFRGFLFVGLQRSRIGAVGTVIFTSLVWASLHLQYNISGMATIVMLGLVLGVVRFRTRSLWSTILFHSLWNFMALLGTAISLRGVSEIIDLPEALSIG